MNEMRNKLPLEWYQRNRKKYWVIILLTTGFAIGLPFVIVGIILEIAYQRDRNQLKQVDKERKDEEDRELGSLLERKKTEKILYSCPNCGSRHIKAYRFAPYFSKEYHCEECDYMGTHVKRSYRK